MKGGKKRNEKRVKGNIRIIGERESRTRRERHFIFWKRKNMILLKGSWLPPLVYLMRPV
jgi:hypothetical protein